MPRAGLTPEVVTRAAAELADENGWQQLTLASVAERLGVRQPSLYKHVASLAALRRSVSVLAVTELGDRLAVAVAGRAGPDALLHLADSYRQYAHQHPGRYAASIVAPADGDAEHIRVSQAALRTIAAVLRGYGFPDAAGAGPAGDPGDGVPAGHPTVRGTDTWHAIRGLRAMLHGFVALEAAGGFGMPLDLDESYRRLVVGVDAALGRQAVDAGPAEQVDRASQGAADRANPRGTVTAR